MTRKRKPKRNRSSDVWQVDVPEEEQFDFSRKHVVFSSQDGPVQLRTKLDRLQFDYIVRRHVHKVIPPASVPREQVEREQRWKIGLSSGAATLGAATSYFTQKRYLLDYSKPVRYSFAMFLGLVVYVPSKAFGYQWLRRKIASEDTQMGAYARKVAEVEEQVLQMRKMKHKEAKRLASNEKRLVMIIEEEGKKKE